MLGLEIITVEEILKWDSQWLNLMQVLVMKMMFFRHVLSLRMILRCLYNNLSGPEVDELLHLVKELTNSSLAKFVQDKNKNNLNLSRTSVYNVELSSIKDRM